VAGGDLGEGTRLAALTGAGTCFEDEAGASLRPGRARAWAPRGHTPVTRVSGNSGRLSVAGIACLKPGRPGRLVTAAHSTLNAPVVLVWDNLSTHRSHKMRQFTEANSDWLTVIRLPAYAPDLNAVEGAWSVMKSGLGNHAATTLDQLEVLVRGRRAREEKVTPSLSPIA
jgi:DDE superfamily endonuclease